MEINITDKIKIRKLTKWLIGVVTACILIYLGMRHLNMIAAAISWLVKIMFPLLLGVVMAFVLNVPMRPIEKHLRLKHKKAKRPLAIFLSLVFVLGIIKNSNTPADPCMATEKAGSFSYPYCFCMQRKFPELYCRTGC